MVGFDDLKVSANEICLAVVKLILEDLEHTGGFGGRFPQVEVGREGERVTVEISFGGGSESFWVLGPIGKTLGEGFRNGRVSSEVFKHEFGQVQTALANLESQF